jgi:hypothetical protein
MGSFFKQLMKFIATIETDGIPRQTIPIPYSCRSICTDYTPINWDVLSGFVLNVSES